MKKVLSILILAFAFLAVNAQSKGVVYSPTVDTVQGAETIYININTNNLSGDYVMSIQASCTQTGGTSDGSIVLQASTDGTSFQDLTETTGSVNFYPNDTLTITNGAVFRVNLLSTPDAKYRLKVVGTSGDSTLITPKYMIK